VLAVIIVVMIVFALFGFPWLWPKEKWADFWVAVVSGVIITATIGALATFLVERILKEIEERRLEKQFQAACEKEWAEFEQRLYYRLLEEETAFAGDIDYANMAIPRHIGVIASLIETAPLSRWQQGLSSLPQLFLLIKNFDHRYLGFKIQANVLARNLKRVIYYYNKKEAPNRNQFDDIVNENALLAFLCNIDLCVMMCSEKVLTSVQV